jgi:hypothetical protein
MGILDSDLLTEIQTDPAGLGYAGAGASIIHGLINAEGSASVEEWIVSPNPMPREKGELLKLMSDAEAAAMQDLLDSGTTAGKALKFKLSQAGKIDMAHPVNRQTVTDLSPSVITVATRDAWLRLGEVRKSRAFEIANNEPISLDQIKRVLGVP